MGDATLLGSKVRVLRRRHGLTQAALAEKLGISASYLNLIEHNRRPLSAPLLIKVAETFSLDLKSFSGEHDARLAGELMEVFGDSLFDDQALTPSDVRELCASSPSAARAILTLYQAYRISRESAASLAATIYDKDDLPGVDRSRLPSEEVSDFVQQHVNHFPDLETGADALWRDAHLEGDTLFQGLVRYLEEVHGVRVVLEKASAMRGAVRRLDLSKRRLILSEVLRRGSRNFQLAYQIGLLSQGEAMERLVKHPLLTTDASRALARVALANYFAGAVLMPYGVFLEAAQAERYDIELLGHRFRASFEQVCHRLATLRRPQAQGVPFHFVRIDIAGNISKRFSASGLRFARFSGACPRWNVFAAFLTPGMIRTQVSQMPDGATYFWIARTVRKEGGGYHSPHTTLAVGMGCEVSHARRLVYADGVDLESREAVVPVGLTCRLCERADCEQRAFPAIQHPLRVDENVRGVSFYAPVEPG